MKKMLVYIALILNVLLVVLGVRALTQKQPGTCTSALEQFQAQRLEQHFYVP
ncbi:MAG: hypothetical protein ACXIT9_10825 [Nitritalea sp.]